MDRSVVATLSFTIPGAPPEVRKLHEGEAIKVGRDSSCEVSLVDPGVSRIHAALTASACGVVLADLASTNGTFVNGNRISTLTNLSSADVIDIGSTKLTIQIEAEKLTQTLSASSSNRAMTAQLKTIFVAVLVTTVDKYNEMLKSPKPDLASVKLLEWIETVTHIVESYDGVVDKSIGGSIVSIWQGEKEAQLAIKAAHTALQIQDLAHSFGSKVKSGDYDQQPWSCTQVLSSGRGLLGVLGAAESSQGRCFTMLGDPIQNAFRLAEIVGKLGENLIVAESTAAFLKDTFILSKIIKVKIPGQVEGMDTYTIRP